MPEGAKMIADPRPNGRTTEPEIEIRLSATITQPEPRARFKTDSQGRTRVTSGRAGRLSLDELAVVEITFDKHQPESTRVGRRRRSHRAWYEREKAAVL